MFHKIIFIVILFIFLTGMRVILRDGNYIDVDDYYFHKNKVVLKFGSKIIEINEKFVDKDSTLKLNYLEEKKINILKSYTSFYPKDVDKTNYLFKKAEKEAAKHSNNKDAKIKLETRKEKSAFFSEETIKDENFLEKIQRKGIMIKIQVPVIEDKH
jgi:hypothetical protein